MYYYVNADTYIFAQVSPVPLDDHEHLLEVPIAPSSGLSRWDPNTKSYALLSEAEIGSIAPEEEAGTNDVADVFRWNWSATFNNRNFKNGWLQREGKTSTWNCPFFVTVDSVLYRLSIEAGDEDEFKLLIYRNKKSYLELIKPAGRGGIAFDLNLTFDKGDRVSLYALTDYERENGDKKNNYPKVSYPGCTLYFKELI